MYIHVLYVVVFSCCSVLHTFVVNHLLHSSGHLLLVNTLGTGVNAINRMTSLAIRY